MRPHLVISFCWLVLFSRVGICIHAALGEIGLWLYVAACFAYTHDLHITLPRRLRLWQA